MQSPITVIYVYITRVEELKHRSKTEENVHSKFVQIRFYSSFFSWNLTKNKIYQRGQYRKFLFAIIF